MTFSSPIEINVKTIEKLVHDKSQLATFKSLTVIVIRDAENRWKDYKKGCMRRKNKDICLR